MNDKKLTDNEIIKALESEIHLAEYVDSDCCSNVNLEIIKSALDLINRLQAELKVSNEALNNSIKLNNRLETQNKDLAETVHNLTLEKDALFDKAEELKAEVERLYIALEENQKATKFWKDKSETIKAEAYKEFAELLCDGRVANDNTVILAKCLLKELVGENGYRTFNENSCS